jgi:hypothetical protein|tara:strand:+ start:738 stop:953 length:216 start_codon:yes stop_codon:yes gene_type:complete
MRDGNREPYGTYLNKELLGKVKEKMKLADKYLDFTDWLERAMEEYVHEPCNSCGKDHDPHNCHQEPNSPSL